MPWSEMVLARSRHARGRAAVTAALVVALTAPMIELSLRPMTEQLALFWSLLALYLASRPGLRPALMAGGALGFAYLTHPNNAVLLPALALSVGLHPGART